QGSAPGAGPDDSYAMDRWHDLKVFLTGGVTSTRFVSHADYRNQFFPLSMNRPVQNACQTRQPRGPVGLSAPIKTEGNHFFSRGTWLAHSLLDFTFFFALDRSAYRMLEGVLSEEF
ncbi:MAG: hypothetical protein ACREIQ_09300, partial [Nitrospiria bacterium]